jgi:hypothetical protein
MADQEGNIEDAVWALIFFGIGSIIFMNRSENTGAGLLFAGSISMLLGCAFVFRLLVKPRR